MLMLSFYYSTLCFLTKLLLRNKLSENMNPQSSLAEDWAELVNGKIKNFLDSRNVFGGEGRGLQPLLLSNYKEMKDIKGRDYLIVL